MTEQLLLVAGLAIGALLVIVVVQRMRLMALLAVAGCMANDHDWQLMTGGRAGFVRWYHCGRPGCTATRFVKGSDR